MPVDQSESVNDMEGSQRPLSVINFSSILPRLSLKAGLTVFLSVGLLLLLLSRSHLLLVHLLIEISSVILLAAVFLIGWNTRQLVRRQFFLILAIGFFASELVDLLLVLTSQSSPVSLVLSSGKAAQLWLIARALGAFAFLCAILSLGHKDYFTDKEWLLGFLLSGVGCLVLVWPLEIFPSCIVEGGGFTPFKVNSEYALIGLLCVSALSAVSPKKIPDSASHPAVILCPVYECPVGTDRDL